MKFVINANPRYGVANPGAGNANPKTGVSIRVKFHEIYLWCIALLFELTVFGDFCIQIIECIEVEIH